MKQDDYLALSEYQGHGSSEGHKDFSIFEKDGEFYFAMLDKNGDVALRSEGYTSAKGRDNGIQSVIKNRTQEERWSITEAMKHFFLSLKAGNNQEIGKSGALNSKAEAEAYLAFLLGKGGAVSGERKAATAGVAAAAVTGKVLSVKRNLVRENRRVINETRNPKGETRNLIGENRRQIGETRNLINTNQRITKYAGAAGAAALGAMTFAELTAAQSSGPAKIKEAVPARLGGWWPLFLLLLPLLFFLIPIGAVPIPAAIGWKAAAIPPPVIIKKCDCDALTHPVFKIPDGEPPKNTTRLGLDPEYGNSHGLTPAQFYNKLKTNYDGSAKERQFLDGIFKQMGYENGFKDASASLFREVTIPRGINANLGGNKKHKTYYRKMMTNGKDREAFKITAANYCDMYFMKTCGNHMYYNENCKDGEEVE